MTASGVRPEDRDEKPTDHTDPRTIDPDNIPSGTKIGVYTVLNRVSRGGFGTIYRVLRGASHYALKLSQDVLGDMDGPQRVNFEERTRREMSALTSLSHPNIVRAVGFDTWPGTDGFFYIVMEYLDARPLKQWVNATKPTVRTLCQVFADIADAIQAMHQKTIYHRDLKSENILVLTEPGGPRPVVIDFGIAKAETSGNLTTVQEMIGTQTHFAPEYVAKSRSGSTEEFKWGPAQDLHSFGYCMYEAFTGRRPFRHPAGASQNDILDTIQSAIPATPSTVNTHLPAKLDTIILTLLEKDPANRYASAADVKSALDETVARYADSSWDVPLELAAPSGSNVPTARKKAPATASVAFPTAEVFADNPNVKEGVSALPPAELRDPLSDNALARLAEAAALQEVAQEMSARSVRASEGAQGAVSGIRIDPAAAAQLPVEGTMRVTPRPAPQAPASAPGVPVDPPRPDSRERFEPPAPRSQPVQPAPPVRAPLAAADDAPLPAAFQLTGVQHAAFEDPGVPTAVRRAAASASGAVAAAGARDVEDNGDPYVPTAIRRRAEMLKSSADTLSGSGKHRKVNPIVLVGGGVVLLLLVFIVAASKSSAPPPRAEPVSLLDKVQAESPALPAPPQSPIQASAAPGLVPPIENTPPPPPEALGQPPEPPAARRSSGDGGGRRGDGGSIDQELHQRYGGRPVVNDGSSPPPPPPRQTAGDGPIRRSVAMAGGTKAPSTGRKLGVPMGVHIPVKLLTPLDSRTVSGGWVEVQLVRPFAVRGEVVLPGRSIMFGRASGNSTRFTIAFDKIRLPDDSEVAFKAYAVDRDDGKPGLVATRRIELQAPKEAGTGEKIARNSAGIALSAVQGGLGTQAGREAAQIAVDDAGKPKAAQGGEYAILLDPGGMLEVWVEEAF